MTNSDDTSAETHTTLFTSKLRDVWHLLVLAGVMVFMFATRTQTWQRFVTEDTVYFSGNDAWYHFRQVKYTVANWPNTMGFDPGTGYPTGVDVGQFGTLYDQILATVALLLGLGDPSDKLIGLVMIFTPAVVSALIAIPVYLLGKRLGNTIVGVLAALILALLPGLFFSRGLVGVADHNIAEPLFMVAAVLATAVAVKMSDRKVIVWEVLQSDRSEAISTLKYAALAGVVLALYMWVWPPGVFLLGIFGVFYTVKAVIDEYVGRTSEPTLVVGATSFLVAGLLMLIQVNRVTLDPTHFGLIQPAVALGGLAWFVGLAVMARSLESANVGWVYPASVSTAIVGIIGVATVVAPDAVTLIQHNVVRVIGFGTHAETQTIAEAKPFGTNFGSAARNAYEYYGAMFFVSIVGLFSLVYSYIKSARGDHLLVVVWALFIGAAAFTQVRFNYYLAPVVAVTAAYGLYTVLDLLSIPGELPELDTTQYVALGAVLLLFIPTLMVPAGGSVVATGQQNNVGDYTNWEGSLDWMASETPAQGTLGSAENSMAPYGEYTRPSDGDFEYPNGAYGVMSWWDYGHWITATGERTPVANPFQQHATPAAHYLLAQSESEATAVVENMSSESGASVRYTMVDWQMVDPRAKLHAPATFHDRFSQQTLFRYMLNPNTGQIAATIRSPQYYNSLMVRLYSYHGSAVQASPMVVDYSTRTVQTDAGQQTYLLPNQEGNQTIIPFQSMQKAKQYVQNHSTAQVGGYGQYPTHNVESLKHYRYVKGSESPAPYGENSSWVKTFERVPGATIEGDGPANATVRLSVPMRAPSSGNFTYTQYVQVDENGEFTTTVPYSTTGYDNWGPENGYTNVSVRATGPYQLSSVVVENQSATMYSANMSVPEGAVNGASDSPVTVTMTAEDLKSGEGGSGDGDDTGQDNESSE